MGIANLKFKRQDGTYIPLYAAPPAQSILGLLGLGATSIKYLDQIFKGNINIFSKHKPVKENSVSPDANFWKADGNCGITIPQLADNISDIATKKWSYDRPRGNNIVAGEYLRVRDFFYYGNYDRLASPCISSNHNVGIIYDQLQQNTNLSIRLRAHNGSSTNVGITDISRIRQMYAAICIVRSGDNPSDDRAQTTSLTLVELAAAPADKKEVVVPYADMTRLLAGNYDIYLYLRSATRNFADPHSAATKLSIYDNPSYLNPIPLTVTARPPLTFKIISVKSDKFGEYKPLGNYQMPATPIRCLGQLYFMIEITNVTNVKKVIPRLQMGFKVAGFYTTLSNASSQDMNATVDADDSIVLEPNQSRSYAVEINYRLNPDGTQNNGSIPSIASRRSEIESHMRYGINTASFGQEYIFITTN